MPKVNPADVNFHETPRLMPTAHPSKSLETPPKLPKSDPGDVQQTPRKASKADPASVHETPAKVPKAHQKDVQQTPSQTPKVVLGENSFKTCNGPSHAKVLKTVTKVEERVTNLQKELKELKGVHESFMEARKDETDSAVAKLWGLAMTLSMRLEDLENDYIEHMDVVEEMQVNNKKLMKDSKRTREMNMEQAAHNEDQAAHNTKQAMENKKQAKENEKQAGASSRSSEDNKKQASNSRKNSENNRKQAGRSKKNTGNDSEDSESEYEKRQASRHARSK